MPILVTLPRLSDTMEEGTLIKWRIAVGDAVSSGDILADVETDKATMELESYDEGTVAKIVVVEKETAPVGQVMLVMAEEGESVEDAIEAAGDLDTPGQPASDDDEPVSTGSTTATAVAPPGRIRVSPVARKIAEEHGVDLAAVKGTGPDGRIIKRDVLAVAGVETLAPSKPASVTPSTPTPVPALESKLIPLTSKRKTIARRLTEAKATVPHFTVTIAVDAAPLLSIRKQINNAQAASGIKLSVNDFIVRASALALTRHPGVNSSWTDDGIVQHASVNVGIAVAIPPEQGGGLVVPVIRDVVNKTVVDISAATKQLAGKARGGGLSIDEMSDGTFTVSNLGMFGVDHFEAIINPPQAAILAVGSALESPVVRDGQLVVGQEMACTASFDHRVVDGAMGAEFLQSLRFFLENPAAMLI